ncbi:zinc-binding dehydrogenase [Candidatus Lokiarchaeum ossiferum]|uniref:zinc-binding dehydrogenase n=1 Tax=Candidatus Lokiarchaeum ossiferum TaxID=2951803 RepID=UPI00352F27E7
MQALMFDFKMWKVILKKIHLGSSFLLTKYSRVWKVPEISHPTQIRVKSLLGGICASDLHQIDLNVSLYESILASPQNPFPLGHEVVGVIDEIGKEVTSFSIGDRVVYTPIASCNSYGLPLCPSCQNNNPQACLCIAGNSMDHEISLPYRKTNSFGGFGGGGFSEFFLGFQEQMFKIPQIIPDEHAVLVEPLAVAIHAVLDSPPQRSDNVIVIGAGIIGLMTILVLKHFFPKVTIISLARYAFQAEKARLMGASHVIQERDLPKRKKEITSITQGTIFKPTLSPAVLYGEKGPDIIYDCVANEKTVDESLSMIKHHGTIVFIGMGFTVTKHIDWSLQIHKEIIIRGAFVHGIEAFQNETKPAFAWAIDLLSLYTQKFTGLVTHFYKIADYKKAIAVARTKGKNQAIKVVFDFR